VNASQPPSRQVAKSPSRQVAKDAKNNAVSCVDENIPQALLEIR
jgi:hypothetical protein